MVAAPRRYRLKLATWTVVREPGQPSPRTLSSPLAVVELAKDLVLAADDDKEHFWVVLLNAQNHYLLHTEVPVGTQSASLVHPLDRDCYLDLRRSDWCQAERLGHVRAMHSPDGLVVCVHIDHGQHIIQTVALQQRSATSPTRR